MQSAVSRPRALNVTGILDASFRLYRKHFWTYLAIVMIIEIPALVLLITLASVSNNELLEIQDLLFIVRFEVNTFYVLEHISAIQPLHLFSSLGITLLLQMYTGVLINATAQIYHTGSTSVAQAYRVSIVPIIIIGLLGFIGNILFISLFLLCLFFFIVLLQLPFVCIYQIMLFEKSNPLSAVVRNWSLIQGSVRRILGLLFLLYVLKLVFYGISEALLTYSGIFHNSENIVLWISAILTYVVSLLLISFSTIVFTLLYFELRARRDGYDLELKTQQHFANS